MRVLILFPGKTDEGTYLPIASELEKRGIQHTLRIGSAHKSPDLVREILEDEFDLVISGAGLSAALPGVIAAETLVPVLGVPCPGAYGGLDAFLSIAQMPPGVPVLCVRAGNAPEETSKILKVMESGTKVVNVVGKGKAAEKATRTLEEMGIGFVARDSWHDGVNIVFSRLGDSVKTNDSLTIYCPVADHSSAEDAVRCMESCSTGLWVGLNRGENAAIAAVQMLRDIDALTESRKRFEDKCRTEDIEVRTEN